MKSILRVAKETLRVKYLTGGDGEIIERGIYYLIRGDDLLKHEDPEFLREAAWLFLHGGYYLGSRGPVSESEREYWRRESCRAGGEKEDEPQRMRKVWEAYAKKCLAKSPGLSIALMVDSLLVDNEAPKCLPKSRDYLLKKVGKIKKEMDAVAGKKDVLQAAKLK